MRAARSSLQAFGPSGAAIVALLLRAASGRAAEPASSTTESDELFYEGNTLMTEGKVGEACEKFGRSLALVRRGGTLLNLALCREAAGDLVTAFALFEEALDVAGHDGRAARAETARQHLHDLRARLAWITVTVPAAAALPALEIRIDDALLPPEKWAAPVPLLPGKHVIAASAPGKQRFEFRMTGAKAGEPLSVEIPVLQGAAGDAPPRSVVVAPRDLGPAPDTAPPPEAPDPTSLSHARQVGAQARFDVDPIHPGGRAAVGPVVALGDHFEAGFSVLLGREVGVEPQLTFYVLGRSALKPLVNVGLPVFFADGGQTGIRGAAGLQWDVNRHFGVLGQAGGAYFPRAPAGVARAVLLLAAGVEVRL